MASRSLEKQQVCEIIAQYAYDLSRCRLETGVNIWQKIEAALLLDPEAISQMPLKVQADLSVVCAQQGIDGGILQVVKDASLEYMQRIQSDQELNPADGEALSRLIGNLQLSSNLDPKFLGLIVEKLTTSIDVRSKNLTMEHVSRLYLALSRVQEVYVESGEPAAMQNYRRMRDRVVKKILDLGTMEAADQQDKLTAQQMVTLCLPLALDAEAGNSDSGEDALWKLFRGIVYDHASTMSFEDMAMVTHSFFLVNFEDEKFWQFLQRQFTTALKENSGDPKTLAGVCFAFADASPSQFSPELLDQLLQEINSNTSSIQSDQAAKDTILEFLTDKRKDPQFAQKINEHLIEQLQ